MKTLNEFLNESQKMNWNMTPEQILAVFCVLSYADENTTNKLAELVHIDNSVFDELRKDFGSVVDDNIINRIDTYKDLESNDIIAKSIKNISK